MYLQTDMDDDDDAGIAEFFNPMINESTIASLQKQSKSLDS